MKTLLALLFVSSLHPLMAQAQVDEDFDLDLDPVISEDIEEKTTKSKTGKSDSSTAPTSLNSGARQNRSIYIVNQASSGAKADASSKTEQNDTSVSSRADELRRNRQRAELETELKATEKIEESRLQDERRRSDALFGERYERLENANRPAPVVIAAPVVDHQEEVPAPVKAAIVKEKMRARSGGTPPTSSYFIGLLGFSQFPRAENIQANGLVGAGLGIVTANNFLVEALFQYGAYRNTFPWPQQINEYSAVASMKYQFGNGTIIPIAGATISYSYRTYLDMLNGAVQGTRQSASNALDAGVLGGAELTLTESFSLGVEFRYLWNLTSQTDGYYVMFFPNSAPMDNFSHYILGLTTRYNF